MEKPASVQYPVHDLIRRRWSPVSFADRNIEREKIGSLLEAARWASSSFNEQPWRFIIATKDDPAEFGRMLDCIVPANVEWAQSAPLLIITVAKHAFTKNEKANRHAWHDVGSATTNLILQAVSMGIFVHSMAGFDAEKARATYSIPRDFEAVAAHALGYPGDWTSLPEGLQQRQTSPRSRKSLPEIAFTGEWGQSFLTDSANPKE